MMGGGSPVEGTKTWRVLGVTVSIDSPIEELMEAAAKRLGLHGEELAGFKIARRSVDLRGQRGGRQPKFVVHADCVCPAGYASKVLDRSVRSGRVVEVPHSAPLVPSDRIGGPSRQIVVIGSGPAGVFAALPLALAGNEVTVLDRGGPLAERSRDLVAFHRSRVPNPESNLLYGEGGAGTYSDGKLYTRSDDPLEGAVLAELVRAGAPGDICFDSRAHVGTDKLQEVLLRLRTRLEEAGVRFLWRTRMDDLSIRHSEERQVEAVLTSSGEIPCDAVVLAIGHSARDSWCRLRERGVEFEPKAFQVGVRVEHPQELIDRGRYGDRELTAKLGVASYELVAKGLGAHTFCMCPGGRVVASVQSEGILCTNGMSNSTHSSGWANSAVVGTVRPPVGADAFWGVEFQEGLEHAAFAAGGGDYTAPAQLAGDFVRGLPSKHTPHTTYPFGTRPGRIDSLLPDDLRARLVEGLMRFDEQIPGFSGDAGVLVGVETRSSGPIRISRHPERRNARGFSNLFPVGEGAGYAGGIMTAATDGARTAHAMLGSTKQH